MFLDHIIYEDQIKKRPLASWHKLMLEDFLKFLEASIACIGPWRIAHLPDKVYTKGTSDIAVWCSKPWPIMIFVFDTQFLVWRVHTRTSSWYSGLRCLLDLLKAMLHLVTMRSIATNMPKGYTWPMVSIQGSWHLRRQSPLPYVFNFSLC
jgi:hypothetical protein